MSEGTVLSQDKSSNEKIFKVTDNGNYVFRIVGNNGRRIKVSCTVTNAIPIKIDLLTAIRDITNDGISKCKIIGKTSDTAEEEKVVYSLNSIVHKGNLVLDGVSSVCGFEPSSSKVYTFGNSADIASENGKYAQNTVVFKVEGNLTINSGVTVTSISNSYGGPKGLILYCTGNLINNGIVTMSERRSTCRRTKCIYL